MPERGEALAARALALLPADVSSGVSLGAALPWQHYPLLTGEDTGGMVARRAAEFSAGRHAARQAMAGLGRVRSAIPKGPDRAPVWPDGLVGSITHSAEACIAAVALKRSAGDLSGKGLSGIGLDAEPLHALDPGLAALITGPLDQVQADAAMAGGDPALMLFCAKEAAYKAQYPLSQRILGPEDIVISIEGDRFEACLAASPALPTGRINGRIAICAGHILAVAWI
ncbi:phosphopantetheinyl transferase [Xinfangfangia sp. D13-10-4-6]|uniref:4'-phosphopantetheinyl transferase family protein n=1 Tax=Pseudogemmobacter hezensis TaxID=2737662 RepID=UPI0015570D1D|nr:phosphopantetheinyl transferase [Pseudogemmobacter hezensis]NPD13864.1 phosphopantetheinyl transferase [Pseudogemmobacter hezensis]